MPYGFIYKIVFPNEKHYIGLTSRSLEERRKEHILCAKNGDTKCLYNALRKYDMVDTFELVEIDTADTLEELCEKEIGYIQEYNSYYMDGNGYNMTFGGEGTTGYVYTENDKLKMSASQLERFKNSEEIEKASIAAKKRFTKQGEKEAHCIRMNKRFVDNPELREKMSKLKNKYFEEHPKLREKMSEAQKKRFVDNPESRKEHGEKMKKHYIDNPEAKEKMSEIRKQYFVDNPEARQKASETTKQYFVDNPAAGKEQSEKKKQYFVDNPAAGKEHSEKIKEYYSNPENKKYILDKKGFNKPFDIFKIDGTFVKTFAYRFEAIEYLQKEHNITSLIKIGEVLNGKRNKSAGFVFKYKE
jgi:hypothetical protein